jgi:hypothetical protein
VAERGVTVVFTRKGVAYVVQRDEGSRAGSENLDGKNGSRSNDCVRPPVRSATRSAHSGPSVKPYVLQTAANRPGSFRACRAGPLYWAARSLATSSAVIAEAFAPKRAVT